MESVGHCAAGCQERLGNHVNNTRTTWAVPPLARALRLFGMLCLGPGTGSYVVCRFSLPVQQTVWRTT